MLRDADFGPTRVRAFGSYEFRITDPATFLRNIAGTDGHVSVKDFTGTLKRKLVSRFTDAVTESRIPVLDLGAKHDELGEQIRTQIAPFFQEQYGVTITDFVIENVSLPPEVEKMMDRRTSMGVLGDLGAYQQFQAANAMEAAAQNPGAGGGMMAAGMGMGMGQAMMGQMAQAQQGGQFNPQVGMPSAPPPPPPSAAPAFHYNGAGGQGQFSAQEIAQKVAANRSGQHNIWAAGWPAWKPWSQVAEIAGLVPPEMPPPPGAVHFHYHGPEGQLELSAAEIAARVQASPDGKHMVWRQGFDGWKPAQEVPEISAHLNTGPPPPPPGSPPPPPM